MRTSSNSCLTVQIEELAGGEARQIDRVVAAGIVDGQERPFVLREIEHVGARTKHRWSQIGTI